MVLTQVFTGGLYQSSVFFVFLRSHTRLPTIGHGRRYKAIGKTRRQVWQLMPRSPMAFKFAVRRLYILKLILRFGRVKVLHGRSVEMIYRSVSFFIPFQDATDKPFFCKSAPTCTQRREGFKLSISLDLTTVGWTTANECLIYLPKLHWILRNRPYRPWRNGHGRHTCGVILG